MTSDKGTLSVSDSLTRQQAGEFIRIHHRHHGNVAGYKFCVGAVNGDNQLVAVAIAGRPVSRILDDGKTLEVTRLCTDGTANACSFLYSRCARIAKEMGYRRIITYILESEGGTSLKATGWKDEGQAGGGSWNCPSRPRKDLSPIIEKRRFAVYFGGVA